MTEQYLLNISDGCASLGIGRTTLYELVNAEEVTLVKIGRRSFVTAASVRQYVERLSCESRSDTRTSVPIASGGGSDVT